MTRVGHASCAPASHLEPGGSAWPDGAMVERTRVVGAARVATTRAMRADARARARDHAAASAAPRVAAALRARAAVRADATWKAHATRAALAARRARLVRRARAVSREVVRPRADGAPRADRTAVRLGVESAAARAVELAAAIADRCRASNRRLTKTLAAVSRGPSDAHAAGSPKPMLSSSAKSCDDGGLSLNHSS